MNDSCKGGLIAVILDTAADSAVTIMQLAQRASIRLAPCQQFRMAVTVDPLHTFES